jgi:hypothetical protein
VCSPIRFIRLGARAIQRGGLPNVLENFAINDSAVVDSMVVKTHLVA